MKKLILLFAVSLQIGLCAAQSISRNESELFVEILERGDFVVYVDNEFVGSSNGRFRFYDISNPNPVLSIRRNNAEILKKRISLPGNTRLILSYTNRTLRELKSLPLYGRHPYVLDNWDGGQNDGRPTNGGGPASGRPEHRPVATGLSPETFDRLLASVKKEPFDDEKIKLITAVAKQAPMITSQLAPLLKDIRSDERKLQLAKALYASTADKQNYFTLADVFTFQSSKKDLMDYLNKI